MADMFRVIETIIRLSDSLSQSDNRENLDWEENERGSESEEEEEEDSFLFAELPSSPLWHG